MNERPANGGLSFVRVMLLCLGFFGFPLLLGLSQYHQILDEQERIELGRRETSLDKRLSQVTLGSHWDYFLDLVRSGATQVFSSENPLRDYVRMVRTYRRLFPGLVRFIFFRNGKLVPSFSDIAFPEPLASLFVQEQARCLRGDPGAFVRDIPLFRRFFGPLLWRGNTFDATDDFSNLSYQGPWIRGYFSALRGGISFIVLLRNDPRWPSLLQRAKARLEAAASREERIRLIDLRRGLAPQERGLGTGGNLGMILARAGDRPGTFLALEGRLWGQRVMPDGKRLLIGIGDGTDPAKTQIRRRMNGLAVVLLSVFSLWTWLWLQMASRSQLSITWKLGALFVFVVGLPLALLAISARGLLVERRQILETQTFLEQEKSLLEFDRRFLAAIGRLEVQVRRGLSARIDTGPAGKAKAREWVRRISRSSKPAIAELFDEKGKSHFHFFMKTDSLDDNFITILANATRNLINDLNGVDPGGADNLKDQFLSTTAEMFGVNIDLVFSLLAQNLGYLYEFDVGANQLKTILYPIRDASGRTRFIALLAWLADRIQLRYVERRLASFQAQLPGTGLLAYNQGKSQRVLAACDYFRIVEPWLLQVSNMPLALQIREERDGKTWLMTGLQGRQLNRFQLWAGTTDEKIRVKIRSIAWQYGGVTLAMMIIACTVGGFLVRRFLEPVRNLSAGVEALRNREFRHRIPVLDHDEMGRLSETFNGMLEGLEDLEVAGAVQESFFPSKPLVLNSWNAFGSCRPASRVGGDYFDFFPLDDRRIALMIGDVSGHGVSAALVVAMAKALVAHPANEFDPGQILTMMQGVFAETLNRKKMMTCFFAVFETDTGRLTAANAGQNYPYIVRGSALTGQSGKRCETIELCGNPLGVKIRRPITPQEFFLGPEDWLLLYTDGFVEALDRKGAPIGYERVEAALPEIGGNDARETEGKLRLWFERLAEPGPLADDISLVVLQRARQIDETG